MGFAHVLLSVTRFSGNPSQGTEDELIECFLRVEGVKNFLDQNRIFLVISLNLGLSQPVVKEMQVNCNNY